MSLSPRCNHSGAISSTWRPPSPRSVESVPPRTASPLIWRGGSVNCPEARELVDEEGASERTRVGRQRSVKDRHMPRIRRDYRARPDVDEPCLRRSRGKRGRPRRSVRENAIGELRVRRVALGAVQDPRGRSRSGRRFRSVSTARRAGRAVPRRSWRTASIRRRPRALPPRRAHGGAAARRPPAQEQSVLRRPVRVR